MLLWHLQEPGRLDACVSHNVSQSEDIFQPNILSSNLKSIWEVVFHYNSNFYSGNLPSLTAETVAITSSQQAAVVSRKRSCSRQRGQRLSFYAVLELWLFLIASEK